MIETAAIAVQEKPILFSGAMVRAVIEDRKTNTRRVAHIADNVRVNGVAKGYLPGCPDGWVIPCPYGQPGDRLWVRETHYRWGYWKKNGKTDKGVQRWKFIAVDKRVVYAATESKESPTHRGIIGWWKRPAIFLPRWASRLTLEIVSVKVERVQDISEEDAIAEGCKAEVYTDEDVANLQISDAAPHIKELGRILGPGTVPAKTDFMRLWDSINSKRDGGKYAWANNPWVWAITFKRI